MKGADDVDDTKSKLYDKFVGETKTVLDTIFSFLPPLYKGKYISEIQRYLKEMDWDIHESHKR